MSTTQTPPSLEARVQQRLAELLKRRGERKESDDLPRNLTQRELNAYVTETAALNAQIAAIQAAAPAASFPTLDLDTKWLAFLNASRKTLGDELMTFTMPVRGEAKQRSEALGWSIKLIDRGLSVAPTWMPITDLSTTPIGQLMHEAGYETQGEGLRGPRGWRGGIAEVEARIKHQTAERDKAIAKLEELLLTDEERKQREAHDERYKSALATMRMKLNRDGNGLVAETTDGDPLPREAMSPEQRAAFERFEKVACATS